MRVAVIFISIGYVKCWSDDVFGGDWRLLELCELLAGSVRSQSIFCHHLPFCVGVRAAAVAP